MPVRSHLPPMENIPALQDALLSWFEANQRPLPWRSHCTPYRVWVSEVMLQQTQMERGVAYFTRWMERFPDVLALAAADEEDVLKAWEGLGYYSRARNLHRAARIVAQDLGGVFPSTCNAILKLPGIGPYTAAAIASIAFGEDVACVDANVERVVTRLCDMEAPLSAKGTRKRIADIADTLLAKGRAGAHNQAMMELGALVCGRGPDCTRCPLELLCIARYKGTEGERPVKAAGAGPIRLSVATGVLFANGRVFVQKRRPDDAWAGLWEFPGGCVEPRESAQDAVVREFLEETGFRVRITGTLGDIRHSYTKYRVTMHCFSLAFEKLPLSSDPPMLSAATDFRWALPEELPSLAMPSAHRSLAERILAPRKGLLPFRLDEE